ncbi:hypothetical protein ACQCN2_06325 [Brevibacillus ginsengisoli]|uniref:hypothetical protein n=1 Tax=Brevibacillus ginsengisoli TaxID=363854 RepID=UPI003CF45E96
MKKYTQFILMLLLIFSLNGHSFAENPEPKPIQVNLIGLPKSLKLNVGDKVTLQAITQRCTFFAKDKWSGAATKEKTQLIGDYYYSNAKLDTSKPGIIKFSYQILMKDSKGVLQYRGLLEQEIEVIAPEIPEIPKKIDVEILPANYHIRLKDGGNAYLIARFPKQKADFGLSSGWSNNVQALYGNMPFDNNYIYEAAVFKAKKTGVYQISYAIYLVDKKLGESTIQIVVDE